MGRPWITRDSLHMKYKPNLRIIHGSPVGRPAGTMPSDRPSDSLGSSILAHGTTPWIAHALPARVYNATARVARDGYSVDLPCATRGSCMGHRGSCIDHSWIIRTTAWVKPLLAIWGSPMGHPRINHTRSWVTRGPSMGRQWVDLVHPCCPVGHASAMCQSLIDPSRFCSTES